MKKYLKPYLNITSYQEDVILGSDNFSIDFLSDSNPQGDFQ